MEHEAGGRAQAAGMQRSRPQPASGHGAMRQAVRRASAHLSALLGSRAQGKVGILMYHRVAEHPPGVAAPTWNVAPRRFRRQMEGLLARGFVPWPLRKLLDHRRRGSPVPPRTFIVTFDDGYESVYRHAWPVLRDLGIPATVFLATAYIGSEEPLPFDDWQEAGSDRVPAYTWRAMSWAQCRELSAGGLIELGAHTHTHQDFRGRPQDLAEDLARCLATLQARLGLGEVGFAFPYGYTDRMLARVVREAGVTCALTTQGMLADPAGDPYDWGRFEATQADSAVTIAACLSGWPDLAKRVQQQWQHLIPPGSHGDLGSHRIADG